MTISSSPHLKSRFWHNILCSLLKDADKDSSKMKITPECQRTFDWLGEAC